MTETKKPKKAPEYLKDVIEKPFTNKLMELAFEQARILAEKKKTKK